jgi:hypothetical protein
VTLLVILGATFTGPPGSWVVEVALLELGLIIGLTALIVYHLHRALSKAAMPRRESSETVNAIRYGIALLLLGILIPLSFVIVCLTVCTAGTLIGGPS